MSSLLAHWLHESVGLSVSSFERDFASGFRFGELLYRMNVIAEREWTEGFRQDGGANSLVSNFSQLARVLKSLGIPFSSRAAGEIMKGRPGAALRLVSRIRARVQKLRQSAHIVSNKKKKKTPEKQGESKMIVSREDRVAAEARAKDRRELGKAARQAVTTEARAQMVRTATQQFDEKAINKPAQPPSKDVQAAGRELKRALARSRPDNFIWQVEALRGGQAESRRQALAQYMTRASLPETAHSARLQLLARWKAAQQCNSDFYQTQVRAQTLVRTRNALSRDQLFLEHYQGQVQTSLRAQALRVADLEAERKQAARAEASEYCRGLVDSLVTLSLRATSQRSLSEKAEVPAEVWAGWMSNWAQNPDVPTPPDSHWDEVVVREYAVQAEALQQAEQLAEAKAAAQSAGRRGKGSRRAKEEEEQGKPEEPVELLSRFSLVPELLTTQRAPSSFLAELEGDEAAAVVSAVSGTEQKSEYWASQVEGIASFDKYISFPPRCLHPNPYSVHAETLDPLEFVTGGVVNKIFDLASSAPPPVVERRAPPRFPLQVGVVGKVFSGRHTVAQGLAEAYKLAVVDSDQLLRQCVEAASADAQSAYQQLGQHIAQEMKAGGVVADEVYVALIVDALWRLRWWCDRQVQQEDAPQAQTVEETTVGGGDDEFEEAALDRLVLEEQRKQRAEQKDDHGDEQTPAEEEDVSAPDAETQPAEASTPNGMLEGSLDHAGFPSRADETSVPGTHVNGFVLVGFPATSEQALLLERALSGYELPQTPTHGTPVMFEHPAQRVHSKLAPVPCPQPYINTLPDGFSALVQLRVPDRVCGERALGRRLMPGGAQVHILSDPPSRDVLGKEELQRLPGTEQDRVPEEVVGYRWDGEQALAKLYGQFGVLVCVDGSGTPDQVLQDVVAGVYRSSLARPVPAALNELMKLQVEQGGSSSQPLSLWDEDGLDSESASGVTGDPEESDCCHVHGGAQSRRIMPLAARSPIRRFWTRLMSMESLVCFEDRELAVMLSGRWAHMESQYQLVVQRMLSTLEEERCEQLHALSALRRGFAAMIARPDGVSQKLINEFQSMYNHMAWPLLRKGRTTDPLRQLLHVRCEQLGSALLSRSAARLRQDARLLRRRELDGWVDARSSLLLSYFAVLLQAECDRYLGTLGILQDYFASALGLPIPHRKRPTLLALPGLAGLLGALDVYGAVARSLQSEASELLEAAADTQTDSLQWSNTSTPTASLLDPLIYDPVSQEEAAAAVKSPAERKRNLRKSTSRSSSGASKAEISAATATSEEPAEPQALGLSALHNAVFQVLVDGCMSVTANPESCLGELMKGKADWLDVEELNAQVERSSRDVTSTALSALSKGATALALRRVAEAERDAQKAASAGLTLEVTVPAGMNVVPAGGGGGSRGRSRGGGKGNARSSTMTGGSALGGSQLLSMADLEDAVQRLTSQLRFTAQAYPGSEGQAATGSSGSGSGRQGRSGRSGNSGGSSDRGGGGASAGGTAEEPAYASHFVLYRQRPQKTAEAVQTQFQRALADLNAGMRGRLALLAARFRQQLEGMRMRYVESVALELPSWLRARQSATYHAVQTLVYVIHRQIEAGVPLHFRMTLEGGKVRCDRSKVVYPLHRLPRAGPFDAVMGRRSTHWTLSPAQALYWTSVLRRVSDGAEALPADQCVWAFMQPHGNGAVVAHLPKHVQKFTRAQWTQFLAPFTTSESQQQEPPSSLTSLGPVVWRRLLATVYLRGFQVQSRDGTCPVPLHLVRHLEKVRNAWAPEGEEEATVVADWSRWLQVPMPWERPAMTDLPVLPSTEQSPSGPQASGARNQTSLVVSSGGLGVFAPIGCEQEDSRAVLAQLDGRAEDGKAETCADTSADGGVETSAGQEDTPADGAVTDPVDVEENGEAESSETSSAPPVNRDQTVESVLSCGDGRVLVELRTSWDNDHLGKLVLYHLYAGASSCTLVQEPDASEVAQLLAAIDTGGRLLDVSSLVEDLAAVRDRTTEPAAEDEPVQT